MANESKSDSFWGNFLECALEFVPDDAGLGILGCIAAGLVVAGIIWAASRLWESILGGRATVPRAVQTEPCVIYNPLAKTLFASYEAGIHGDVL